MGSCCTWFASLAVATKLNGLWGNRLQNSLCIKSVFSTIINTSYKLQKYDILLIRVSFGVWKFFWLYKINLSGRNLWLHYNHNEEKLLTKKLKFSGDSMFENWNKTLLLNCTVSALKCSKTQVRANVLKFGTRRIPFVIHFVFLYRKMLVFKAILPST